MTIHLYLEGMSFRAIGSVLDVHNVTVLNWIRKVGTEAKAYHDSQALPERVEIIVLDELWNFIGKKKKTMDLVCIGQRRETYT